MAAAAALRNAEAAAAFTPTPRMVAFRTLVEGLVRARKPIIAEHAWVREGERRYATDPDLFPGAKRAVDLREYRGWVALGTPFIAWFFETIPELAPVSDLELAYADRLYFDKVAEGVAGGEAWALAEYRAWRAKAPSAPPPGTGPSLTGSTDELAAFAAAATADAWSTDPDA